MLEIQNLVKRSATASLVSGIQLRVASGDFLNIVGGNGSGKSTLLKLIAGILEPDEGDILLNQLSVYENPMELKARLGYIPDRLPYEQGLSTFEFMEFYAACYGLTGAAIKMRIQMLLEQLELVDRDREMIDSLSLGARRRLSIARALIHDPEILVFDEPLAGLDLLAQKKVKRIIEELSISDKTIILSANNINDFRDLSTHIAFLDHGKLLVYGETEDILRRMSISKPLLISIDHELDREKAIRLLRGDRRVKSLMVHKSSLWLGLLDISDIESSILEKLILEGIRIREFHRERGDLETLLMESKRNKRKEEVVTFYDAESDI